MLPTLVLDALNARKTKILTFAQAALHPEQFKAFRKLVLDEFGRNGLERDLELVIVDSRHTARTRNGQE